ncbi:MAG: pyocin knob domain-containing S74 family peptidase [Aeromonas sp.]
MIEDNEIQERGTLAAFQIDKDTKRVESLADYHLYDNGQRVYTPANKPSAADIGAVPKTDVVSGGGNGVGYAQIVGKIPRVGSDGVLEVARFIDFHTKDSTADYDVRLDCGTPDVLNVTGGTLRVEGNDVYHAGNKPTAADVNAVSKSGDTMTGNLVISKNGKGIEFGVGTNDCFVRNTKSNKYIQLMDDGSLSYSGNKIYHNGHKPTASDVGALSLSGGTVKGTISLEGTKPQLGFRNPTDNASTDVQYTDDWLRMRFGSTTSVKGFGFDFYDVRGLEIRRDGDTWARTGFRVGADNHKVYHEGFKPTAADVNAVSKSGDTMTGRLTAAGFTSSTAGNAFSTAKTSDGSYGSVSAESGFVMLWKRNNSATVSDNFIGIYNNTLQFRQDNGTGDKKYKDHLVYHTGHKPSASDVGAIATGAAYLKAETYSRSEVDSRLTGKTIGHSKSLGTEDLDTIKTAGVYHQSSSTNSTRERHYPETLAGSLVVYTAAGIVQEYRVYNSSRVWTRAQYSTGAWTAWAKQYNSLNKPTAADVGALPLTGGTLSGDIKIQKAKAAVIVRNSGEDIPENYGRIRFEHGTGDQHVHILHSVHDTHRAPFGLRVQKGEGNASANGKPWFEVEGEIYADGDKKVYHEGFKPTASDVGAVKATAELIKKSIDLNDYTTSGFYNLYKATNVVFTNAPSDFTYGTLEVIGSGTAATTFATQILTWKDSSRQMIRTRNDGAMAWSPWKKIYSEAQKPTAADVGAVSLSGASQTIASDSSTWLRLNSTVAKSDIGMNYQRFGKNRWGFWTTNHDETGNNAGSDFTFRAYADDGSSLQNVFKVTRATGVLNFDKTPTIGGVEVLKKSSYGVGAKCNDVNTPDAIDYTEDKTRDFNKLVTAGTYTVTSNWKNSVDNKGTEQSVTGVVEVLVRKFPAGPSVIQRFYYGISDANGDGTNYEERTATGAYPDMKWSRWRANGTYQSQLHYRLTIERKGDSGYPYITLHKKDLRTDIAANSWYTANAIQMKDGQMSDENNPDSGKLGMLVAMQKKGDNTENRALIQCRDPNGTTKNEMIMGQEETSFSKKVICKADVESSASITARGHTIQISSNDPNLHYWMRNAAGVERALMWHDGNANTLNLRVKEGSPVTINQSGQLHANDVYIRSDRRLKSDLAQVENALAKVSKLTAYSYNKHKSITDSEVVSREVGLIAQDLQKVLPEAVNEAEDTTLTISNSAVNALLVEAIKELKAEIEELKRGQGK